MSEKVVEYRPTKAESAILEALLNPANRLKTITELCDMLGITTRTYQRAFKKREFLELYNEMSMDMVRQHVGPVINAFLKEAKRGSFQHGKVLLEMAGVYSETTKHELTGADGKPLFEVVVVKPPVNNDGEDED